jgi:hypothetical protein
MFHVETQTTMNSQGNTEQKAMPEVPLYPISNYTIEP